MAKIMYGSMAGAVSGALGNVVFSHNRGGAYTRMRVIPTKVDSVYTQGVRNILSQCSQAWGGLTADEQQAWNTWAQSNPITDRLGQKQVLFGNAAYIQLNARILQAGDTPIDLPPAVVAPSPLTTLTISATEAGATVELGFLPTPIAATERLWIQLALLTNPGRNYFKNLLKLVKVSDLNQATLLDINDEVVARFGGYVEGHRMVTLISVYESTTGLLSGPMLATCTVGA